MKYLAIFMCFLLSACSRVYITGTVQIISIDPVGGKVELAIKSLEASKEPKLSTIKSNKSTDIGSALDTLIADYPEVLFSSASIALVPEDIERDELYKIVKALSEISQISPKLSIIATDNLSLEKVDIKALERAEVLRLISAKAGTELYRVYSRLDAENSVLLPIFVDNLSSIEDYVIPGVKKLEREMVQLLPQKILKLPTLEKTIFGTAVRIPRISYSVEDAQICVNVGVELGGTPHKEKTKKIVQEIVSGIKKSIDSVIADEKLCEALYGQKIVGSRIEVILQE